MTPFFRKRRPNQVGPPGSENEAKGWLVETVTAWTVDFPSLQVEHDVWFKDTTETYERQVDVLVLPLGSLTERDQCIVIECKNEGGPTGIEGIDAFAGKLLDIGVPLDQGWFISVTGFVPNAIQRAGKVGIEALELSGIETKQRLKAEIYEALQTVVFCVASANQLSIAHDIQVPSSHPNEILYLFDDTSYKGNLLDCIWAAWHEGLISQEIGTHFVQITVPSDWFSILGGQRCHFAAIGATVHVTGHVQTLQGEGRRHALQRAGDKTVHAERAEVQFAAPAGTYELRAFGTEAELTEFIESSSMDHYLQRVQVPRLRALDKLYWPPSDDVIQQLNESEGAFRRGQAADPKLLGFLELEGTDVGRAWEQMPADYAVAPVLDAANVRGGSDEPGMVTVTDLVYNQPVEQTTAGEGPKQ